MAFSPTSGFVNTCSWFQPSSPTTDVSTSTIPDVGLEIANHCMIEKTKQVRLAIFFTYFNKNTISHANITSMLKYAL